MNENIEGYCLVLVGMSGGILFLLLCILLNMVKNVKFLQEIRDLLKDRKGD